MKKIIVIMMVLIFLTGCSEKENIETNYSESSFVSVNWIREGVGDIETIRFNTDGSFSYTCACGNPVNDADLCETYTYNEATKEIKLDCFETTEDTITLIKVVSLTDSTLELDFNGELRIFEKESN